MERSNNNDHSDRRHSHRYEPNKNLSTGEKQREYYRQLADERANSAARSANAGKHVEPRRPTVVTANGNPDRRPNSTQTQVRKRKKKKLSRGKKALIVILCFLVVIIAAVCGTGLYYLNLIDYDNGELTEAPVDPNGGEDEEDVLNGELSAEEASSLSSADASINANLDNNEIWYSDDVTNILLMGIDYGSSSYPYGRSDSMIIVSINDVTHKVKLISLGRAAYSAIPGYKNTRLSHAHGYGGPSLAIQAIETNYKVRIDNYASVNFSGFESIIDALGGVTVTLESAEAKAISHLLGTSSAGTYNLNGAQALAFARTRKIDSDKNRTGRQRRVLEALANKATNMSIPDMVGAMDDILPYVKTNMTRTQLLGMMSKAMTYLGYQREEHVLPHKSSDLVLRGGFEVVIVDWQDEVSYVHELIYENVQAKIV